MNGIVAFSLRHRGLVVLLFVLVLLGGVIAFREFNI
jgi:multidrug efflux pump subunit AcrB